ncbi:sialoadhesin-like [Sardina pilchardus]|uniref:sialoadhesin-like n=1 Tax=Sardina pilchardus TaxID=27697 RepID=UPI002E0E179A
MNNCTLRIKNLRDSDTGEQYRFRFITDDPKGKWNGDVVSMTLTELQVLFNPATVKKGDKVTLTCKTTCSLSNNPTYIWYRNSQPLSNSNTTRNTLSITSFSIDEDAGYYSCAVRGNEDHPSPSVCVPIGWSVTYTPQSTCALKGSSVELHSYYTYPCDHTVAKAFWFTTLVDGTGKEDLSGDEHYQGRLDYTENNKNSHTLTIRNLNDGDAKSYSFRFITDKTGGKYSGAIVELTVTELQVLVSPAAVREGDNVTLTCSTTCSLSTNPTYIWYRNSQPLSNSNTTSSNTLSVASVSRVEDADFYSCAVRGHEDLPSPSVCVPSGWSVTYTPQSICALKGSSVELHSYYTYPCDHTVKEAFWCTTRVDGDENPQDLTLDEHYKDRVIYTVNNKNNHTLSIRNLTTRDSNNYRFRFITDKERGRYSDENVELIVTGN